MTNCIENAYGKLYLSEERASEYINIVSKHLRSMMIELKEHKIIPCVVSLGKTTVREYDDVIKLAELKQYQNKNT